MKIVCDRCGKPARWILQSAAFTGIVEAPKSYCLGHLKRFVRSKRAK